ncbi:plasmid partitioning protein RepB [Sulfitobacter sp. EhC04]|uniref:plasmid partitioning protein RepB n=1 Tax=Sulfitobacter sp. EhC04 TaxID=1849168 RepID=UPI0007F4A6F2|nr:plasmid partitioning protein RepB [Sulfitobacter sp. EhC04]OAN76971.1 plasmid partitioning protein RepB [Sulfitobacter sp. EhC04]
MTTRKKRMTMLDGLAAAGHAPPAPGTSMMSTNRALRSARDAVDSHQVWELDPDTIEDGRIADRLDPDDVVDLRDAIETNGQTVPILVRRHPSTPDRYLLVYGRRRLQAIRNSAKVQTVRALIASMGDDAAVKAQISENMARRDLSFIERALFAQELVESGFGNQTQVAEVLTVTKSSVSMAIAIAEMIGRDLIRAIGPAHGIGRPRWEALGKAIEERQINPDRLIEVAESLRSEAEVAMVIDDASAEPNEVSVRAFEAVFDAAGVPERPTRKPKAPPARPRKLSVNLTVDGRTAAKLVRSSRGVSLDLEKGPFADWIEAQGQPLIEELHARWLQRGED